MFREIVLAFIPLFVAMDAIGVLPIFTSFTEDMEIKEKRGVILKSLITAFCLATGFIFLGKAVFRALNITIADFMTAGGILLFCIATIDLLNPAKRRRMPSAELGFVPLGTPLIVGPAVLTTTLLVLDAHGLIITVVAVVVNIILAGIIFYSSEIFRRVLGIAGSRALSKIMSLLLAAIGIMMVRRGIIAMFNI